MKSFNQNYKHSMRKFKFNSFLKRIGTFPILILFVALLFSSCVSHRNLEYLRDKENKKEVIISYAEAKIPDYKLKPNDELNINIKSLDDPATNVFQTLGNQQGSFGGYTTPYSASLTSYMIDRSGFIQLPVIGNMYVKDKTIPEVISMLQDSINNILSSPTVTIKLINRYVSVLGEVARPGNFSYAYEKLNVFDALGLAGDITTYGDRNDVTLVRNENGKNIRIKIDLTSADLMASEYYYLRPNDMIYVKPMQKKFWGLAQFPWTVLLSTISTVILIYTVFGE
jgi:polysaccharide export outer membrane protein